MDIRKKIEKILKPVLEKPKNHADDCPCFQCNIPIQLMELIQEENRKTVQEVKTFVASNYSTATMPIYAHIDLQKTMKFLVDLSKPTPKGSELTLKEKKI